MPFPTKGIARYNNVTSIYMETNVVVKPRLFALLNAADLVVVDGFEIRDITYGENPDSHFVRLGFHPTDGDLEWRLFDQEIELGSDGKARARVATIEEGEVIESDDESVSIEFRKWRPLQVADLADAS